MSSGEDKIVKEWGIESSPEQPEQVKLVLVDQRYVYAVASHCRCGETQCAVMSNSCSSTGLTSLLHFTPQRAAKTSKCHLDNQ